MKVAWGNACNNESPTVLIHQWTDQPEKGKLSKQLNYTMDQMNLPLSTEHFSLQLQNTQLHLRTECSLRPIKKEQAIKQVPTNLKKCRIVSCVFSDHNGMKPEIIKRYSSNLPTHGD